MNANELADELENKPLAYGNDIQEWLGEAATMLRQQQAEIEALKKLISEMKYEKSSGVYEMNNEPVVWMSEVEGGTMYTNYEYPKSIPLYTHPHPDNLGLALSIIKQQEIQIEMLKAKSEQAYEEGFKRGVQQTNLSNQLRGC